MAAGDGDVQDPARSPVRADYVAYRDESGQGGSRSPHSWWSRLFFSYANPVMATGTARQLDLDDLWELRGSAHTGVAFEDYHANYQSHGESIERAILATYWRDFALCGAGWIIVTACNIFVPIMLQYVIDALTSDDLDSTALTIWLIAFFASRLLNAFVSAHMNFRLDNVLIRMLVALKAQVFAKATRRSIRSKNSNGSDESEAPADIANLLTADMDSVYLAGSQIQYVWMAPIQIAIVVYMLYRILDVAVFAGVGVIALTMSLNFLLAMGYTTAFGRIMGFKDARQKAVRELFGAIQIVKLNAWETPFLDRIHPIRDQEMRAIASWMYLLSLTVFLFWTSPVCVSVASFATYVLLLDKQLTASKVFTAMALFGLIREPLLKLPESIQYLIQARIAFKRIYKYLQTDEVKSSKANQEASIKNIDDGMVIEMENASFSWEASHYEQGEDYSSTEELSHRQVVLSNVNLSVRDGDFVVVHGVVGSGKTSLCAAVLGELPAMSGNVFVHGDERIAYYSQQPWIQNRSVRDNILFGEPFDIKRYERVIDACCLGPDLKQFPAGDRTEIGQKGVNLSGGQKARIALARACYSNADILILDSPLAAVDAIVQAQIFSKCFCTLLEHKTIILVTHNMEIVNSGVATLSVHVNGGTVQCDRPKVVQSRRAIGSSIVLGEIDETSDDKQSDEGSTLSTAGVLIEEEGRQEGRVKKEVFVNYFHALGGWKMATLFLLVLIAWQGFQVGSDLWLSYWTGDEKRATESASRNIQVYALLGLGVAVMVFVRTMLSAFVGLRAARHLFDGMTDALVHAPLRFFDANPIGRIINRFSEDISVVDFRMGFSTSGVFVALAVTLAQLGTAAYAIKYSALVFLPLAWVYYKIATFYLASSREISRLMKVAASPVLSHVTQAEEGIVVLRAFGPKYVDNAIRESYQLIDANNRAWAAKILVGQWFALRVQLVGTAIVVLIVSTLVGLRNSLSPGIVGLAFMYAVNIDSELGNFVQIWSWFEVTMVSPERVMEYIGISREGNNGTDQTSQLSQDLTTWPSSGTISFKNVVFNYKPGGDNVLKGVSFDIHGNEKIGIVGRTGAGKSSLTMALFRINELVSGQILIDGVDIATLDLQTLRSRMAIIPQSPVLFQGSMRAYMDPFGEYDDNDIWTAFDKVGLKPMVTALDGKLAHELSENGENFSVGERQMLCLARALLRQSRIVVLDEATASIDHETEQKLQDTILSEFAGATVLTIAHRLGTVLHSDRIMVLGDGVVVEFDEPKKLIQHDDGVFYQLANEGGYLDQLAR